MVTIKNVSEKYESTEDERSNDTDEEVEAEGNAGWADSIAKVLNSTKPKRKKILTLSRAKKIKPVDDDKESTAPGYDFEIDGEIKEEKVLVANSGEQHKTTKNQKLDLRNKPSFKDLEREKALRRVATKGVVQLFNAVRMQQRKLYDDMEKAGPLDSRKEAVLENFDKRQFLDVLMGGERCKSDNIDNCVKEEDVKEEENSNSSDSESTHASIIKNRKKKSQWSVLSDDFMIGKKGKHWDQNSEYEDSDEVSSNNSESDAD